MYTWAESHSTVKEQIVDLGIAGILHGMPLSGCSPRFSVRTGSKCNVKIEMWSAWGRGIRLTPVTLLK